MPPGSARGKCLATSRVGRALTNTATSGRKLSLCVWLFQQESSPIRELWSLTSDSRKHLQRVIRIQLRRRTRIEQRLARELRVIHARGLARMHHLLLDRRQSDVYGFAIVTDENGLRRFIMQIELGRAVVRRVAIRPRLQRQRRLQ